MTDLHTLLSDPYLQGACLAVLLLACVLAVLSRIFDDTLSQRAAMLVVALGATAELSSIWDVLRQAPEANMGTAFTRPSFGVLLCGVAFYAAATAWKIWRRWSLAGRPTHPLRRSTDWDSLSPLPPRDAPVPFPPTVPMDRDERPGRIERREKDAA